MFKWGTQESVDYYATLTIRATNVRTTSGGSSGLEVGEAAWYQKEKQLGIRKFDPQERQGKLG